MTNTRSRIILGAGSFYIMKRSGLWTEKTASGQPETGFDARRCCLSGVNTLDFLWTARQKKTPRADNSERVCVCHSALSLSNTLDKTPDSEAEKSARY